MDVKVKVKPNSGVQNIEKKDNFYLVKLKSPPHNNKANIELVKLLKKYFRCRQVRIKSGLNSRNKFIELIG